MSARQLFLLKCDRCRCSARLHAFPKFVEGDRIEKGGDVDDFSVPHLHEPSVGVSIGFAVEGRRFAVKQRDDRVAIAVKAADGRNERFREAGVEGPDHSVQELVACLVFFRGEGVSRDGPGGIRREKGKGSSRAGTPGVKSGLYGGLVSLLGFRFGGWAW
jgi:hypothetical protein